MKVSAIITEYNPLHKGHMYHINKTKEITGSDFLICVMSGNFAQRGIPSIIDKWNKAKLAVDSGVDLVIELPVIYSLSSAEFFAFGAVSLLNQLGIVDNICFGSELGNIDTLFKMAKIFSCEEPEFKKAIIQNLKNGLSYPTSRNNAFKSIYKDNFQQDSSLLNSPNNILGIEYCKSLIKLNSSIKPYTICRKGSDYNDENLNNAFASATSIRRYIQNNLELENLKSYLPESTFELINKLNSENYKFAFIDSIYPFIKYKMLNCEKKIENLPDASEGIHNRIFNGIEKFNEIDELINFVKSKRYTYTRISRILCQYFIGFDLYDSDAMRRNSCPYVRVLGCNKKGLSILKAMKNNSNIPVYTKLPKNIDRYLELDIKATKAYSSLNSIIKPYNDYIKSPYIIK